MIVHIEKPIVSTKNLHGLISVVCKVVGYKVNIQKLMALLYTNNELSELSGHMPGLSTWSLVGTHMKCNQLMFLSHINFSLSLSLSLPLFLKINK